MSETVIHSQLDQLPRQSPEPLAHLRDRPQVGRPAKPVAEVGQLLVDIKGLSRLLARSEASLYRDDSAGRIPAGLRIGGSKRWSYPEIIAWVEAGMPDRRTWQAMKGTRYGNALVPANGPAGRYSASSN
jgi:predicted DNA-binding transcriptional regulator AlpA